MLLFVFGIGAGFWLAVAPLWLSGKWPLRAGGVGVVVGWLVVIPAGLALVHLRAVDPLVLLAAMAVVWVADIAAYFVGRAFGRRKLAPGISPGKSWEGALGAVVFVVGALLGLLLYWLPRRVTQRQAARLRTTIGSLEAAEVRLQGANRELEARVAAVHNARADGPHPLALVVVGRDATGGGTRRIGAVRWHREEWMIRAWRSSRHTTNCPPPMRGSSTTAWATPTTAPRRCTRCGRCLLYTSPSPRDRTRSRMPSSA